METKKRTSVRKRLLAWLLTVAMVCTSISVPTFAEEIVFDDAMTVDLQGTDDTTPEASDDLSEDEFAALSDDDFTELPETVTDLNGATATGDAAEEEPVFSDGLVEDDFYSDESVIFEGAEIIDSPSVRSRSANDGMVRGRSGRTGF